jgi:hemerythrin
MLQAILPPEMSTGVAAMDELHRDFFEALIGLSSTSAKEFEARYGAFVSKAEHVFSTEEQWMEEIDFPIIKSHREQHARVLSALHHVHSRVMNGDLMTGREVVEKLLPQWFVFHISTMDVALAAAMQIGDIDVMRPASAPFVSYADMSSISSNIMSLDNVSMVQGQA